MALLVPGAWAQGAGAIEVQVTNGTEGGGSVAGSTVTLRAFEGMSAELEAQMAVADAGGVARFEGLDTSAEISYLAGVTYEDVEYSSQPLVFQEGGETTLNASVQVFEATQDPDEAQIRVERMHLFVDFQDGLMSIGELHIFSNAGDRTFIGVEDPALDRRVTLRFALPDGAMGLRFQMGGEGDRYPTTEEGFADTQPVRPGASQQVLYGYSLSYGDADAFEFVRPLLYPTVNLNVLVPRVGAEVTSDQVELSEITTVEGQNYLNLNGENFAAGDELRVRFSGLQGVVPPASVSPASEPARESGIDPKWVALGLAALALVGGVVYPALRRSRASRSPDEPREPDGAVDAQARLDRVLRAIADLDDAFETGGLDEESYRRQREALKREAVSLMQGS
jgi:hypothetical protein